MAIEISILKIKEEEFSFKSNNITQVNEEDIQIGFGVGFDWSLENEIFTIRLSISYNLMPNEERSDSIEILQFLCSISFKVRGISEILIINPEDSKLFHLEDEYMRLFVSTILSSSRGMLFYRTQGTILSEYYLPLIKAEELMQNLKANTIENANNPPRTKSHK